LSTPAKVPHIAKQQTFDNEAPLHHTSWNMLCRRTESVHSASPRWTNIWSFCPTWCCLHAARPTHDGNTYSTHDTLTTVRNTLWLI